MSGHSNTSGLSQSCDIYLDTNAIPPQDAKYNPVRTVLAAVPPSGASKYDMVSPKANDRKIKCETALGT